MKIVSGTARGIELLAPPGLEVRPTSVRARCALMDSLRDFAGRRVADLCAGSGGIGLEAASRGAAAALFVEVNRRHCRFLEDNIAKVRKAGAEFESHVICGSILDCHSYSRYLSAPDLIFADPPYAESAELWRSLCASTEFQEWAQHAKIVWELPDTPGSAGLFLSCPLPGREGRVRRLGPASFFMVD
jgi:16S rRNA (guanine966-N2)-methyltransferase